LAQICTKSFVGWGFAPDPTGGAYSAPPGSLAGLGGGTPGGRGRVRGGKVGRGRWDWDPPPGTGMEWREGWGCEGREGEGKEGEGGRGNKHTRFKTCGDAHDAIAVLHTQDGMLSAVTTSINSRECPVYYIGNVSLTT